MSAIINFLVWAVAAAVVLMIVSRLNLGLTVKNFTSAIIAAIVIALVTAVVAWLLGLFGIDLSMAAGLIGGIIALIVAALVLMFSDRFISGMTVNGFGGAIIGAIAIAVVGWLLNWVLGLLGIGPVV